MEPVASASHAGHAVLLTGAVSDYRAAVYTKAGEVWALHTQDWPLAKENNR